MSKSSAILTFTPEQRAHIRQALGRDVTELAVEQLTAGRGCLLPAAEKKHLWSLKPSSDRPRPRKPSLESSQARFRLKVRKSCIHGWGVFAVEFIPAGCDVIEYVGQIITPQECCQRLKTAKETYVIEVDDARAIDGSVGGSGAEIINHSCSPNTRYRLVDHRVFVHSIRSIAPGEELTADYSFRSDAPRVPCRCGSSTCRGTINALKA